MIAFKILSLILSAQIASALSAIEDKFLNEELMYYFEDVSVDINEQVIAAAHQKREATEVSSDEKRFAALFAPMNLSRANHYWTRKRGGDKDTTQPMTWEVYYSLFTTKLPTLANTYYNDYYNKDHNQKKREMLDQLLDLNKNSSKLQVDVDVKPTSIASPVDSEKPTKNSSDEVHHQIKKPLQNQPAKLFVQL